MINYVGCLQEYCVVSYSNYPKYTIDCISLTTGLVYLSRVFVGDIVAEGRHTTKKGSKQEAARAWIESNIQSTDSDSNATRDWKVRWGI